MGKFLKFIRYIDNLITTMGARFSKKPTTNTQSSSLEQPLLVGETNCSDLTPIQGVSPKIPNMEVFLSSHVPNSEFFGNDSNCEKIEISPTNQEQITVCGSGQLQSGVTYAGQNFQLCSLVFICMGNPLGLTGRILLHKSTCSNSDFVISINGITFILPRFFDFLERNISEGDFKDGLAMSAPNNYQHIWKILTSGMKYTATYVVCRETEMFQHKHSSRFKGRDKISGHIMVCAHGQVRATSVYHGKILHLKKVFFLNVKKRIAEIDSSFFSGEFYLIMNGVEYDLPNYIEVLQGTMSEEAFKTRLRNTNQKHFDKIWKVLTDRQFCHLAIYD